MPLPPPFSTIGWWSCVCGNCRCTNSGRILRFWRREWYILPQTRCFSPVIPGQDQDLCRLMYLNRSKDAWVTQDEPFATLEIAPKRNRFHFEYQMTAEMESQHHNLMQGDENSYVTLRARMEPDDGSTVPPSYQATVGKKGAQRSRVFVDYYLVERRDRNDSKKSEIPMDTQM